MIKIKKRNAWFLTPSTTPIFEVEVREWNKTWFLNVIFDGKTLSGTGKLDVIFSPQIIWIYFILILDFDRVNFEQVVDKTVGFNIQKEIKDTSPFLSTLKEKKMIFYGLQVTMQGELCFWGRQTL
jgi:hypothetical protein